MQVEIGVNFPFRHILHAFYALMLLTAGYRGLAYSVKCVSKTVQPKCLLFPLQSQDLK